MYDAYRNFIKFPENYGDLMNVSLSEMNQGGGAWGLYLATGLDPRGGGLRGLIGTETDCRGVWLGAYYFRWKSVRGRFYFKIKVL